MDLSDAVLTLIVKRSEGASDAVTGGQDTQARSFRKRLVGKQPVPAWWPAGTALPEGVASLTDEAGFARVRDRLQRAPKRG